MTLKTVKLASARYYDLLPFAGNEHGQAFRDRELEAKVLFVHACRMPLTLGAHMPCTSRSTR